MLKLLEQSFNDIMELLVFISKQEFKNMDQIRENLSIDYVPFRYAKFCGLIIDELPKHDEMRLALQALYLLILRNQIPNRCNVLPLFSNI